MKSDSVFKLSSSGIVEPPSLRGARKARPTVVQDTQSRSRDFDSVFMKVVASGLG